MKRGATSLDHWFYIPTEASRSLVENFRISRTAIQRRVDLMLCWWKYRSTPQFVQQDGARMLQALHESGEMDLTTEEGRLAELAAYWMLAFICAHDVWLWDVRAHWENALLKWRVAHFYCLVGTLGTHGSLIVHLASSRNITLRPPSCTTRSFAAL